MEESRKKCGTIHTTSESLRAVFTQKEKDSMSRVEACKYSGANKRRENKCPNCPSHY